MPIQINKASLIQLQARLRRKEPSIYKEILEDCGHYCIKQLIKKTNCTQEEAEDFLMEAILIFSSKIISGEIQKLTSIRAYIFSVCWNKWQEAHRQQKRKIAANEKIVATFYEPQQNIEEQIIAREDKVQRDKNYQKEMNVSRSALRKLGEKCQQILELFYAEEKSMAEIAKTLGYANASTVKNLKARCYKKWVEFAHQLNEKDYE